MRRCRIATEYAEPTLVAAHRALLAAALQDPRNSMFVLLSESCVPLYHPAAIWSQLIAESHISRVSQGTFNGWRWHGNMHTDHFWGMHFRKSAQWSSLTRMHAQLVVEDEHVWPQFAQFCRTLVRFRRRAVLRLHPGPPSQTRTCAFVSSASYQALFPFNGLSVCLTTRGASQARVKWVTTIPSAR